jgi:hypothetical protein
MWIMHPNFFISIVRKGAPGEWQIRARTRRHLERLIKLAKLDGQKIIATTFSDYAFRVVVSAEDMDKVFSYLRESVSYQNVKSATAAIEGNEKYEQLMHRVWSTMNLLQDRSSDRTDNSYEGMLEDDPKPRRTSSGDPVPPASDVARQKRGNGRKRNS